MDGNGMTKPAMTIEFVNETGMNYDNMLFPPGTLQVGLHANTNAANQDLMMGMNPVRSALVLVRMDRAAVRDGVLPFVLTAQDRNVFNFKRKQETGLGDYGPAPMTLSKMTTVTDEDGNRPGVVPQGQTFQTTGIIVDRALSWAIPSANTDFFSNMRFDPWLTNDTAGMSFQDRARQVLIDHGELAQFPIKSDNTCSQTIGALADFDGTRGRTLVESAIYLNTWIQQTGSAHPDARQLRFSWLYGAQVAVDPGIVPDATSVVIAFRVKLTGYSICGQIASQSSACPVPARTLRTTGAPTRDADTFNRRFEDIIASMQDANARTNDRLDRVSENLNNLVSALNAVNKR